MDTNTIQKKFKRILGINYNGAELEKQYWTRIENACDERILISEFDQDLDKYLKDTDCLLVKLGAKIHKKIIDKTPNLKYIGMLGTGYGGIDVEYLKEKRITLCNITDYATQGVAEITFGMIFNHIRDLGRGLSQAETGNYSEAGYSGSEIRGKTFGIIGMGDIGSRVAEIAQAFGANVQYWSKNRKVNQEDSGIEYKELDNLLKTSDFLSVNMALNSKTENFFTEEKIQMIKPNALVINLSPMELFNIKALSHRLSQSNITFILDHADEMLPEDIALIKDYPNCIVQLPIGYTTDEAKTIKQGSFVKSIEDFLKGKPSGNVN